MSEKSDFSKKMGNFWFYYKYYVLLSLAAIAIISYSVASCAGAEKYDCSVILNMNSTVTPEIIQGIELELEKYCDDVNGDGEVNVQVIDCAYNPYRTNENQTSAAKQAKLHGMISLSEYQLYIVDRKAYDNLSNLADNSFFEKGAEQNISLTNTPISALFFNWDGGSDETLMLRIVKRNTNGTSIQRDENVEKYSDIANSLMQKLYDSYTKGEN